MPPFLKQLQDAGSTDRASRGLKRMEGRTAQKALGYSSRGSANASPSSKARQKAHHEFLKATERAWEKVYTDHESLPDLETALAQFKEIYPRYSETLAMESLRAQDYAHLEESGRVCLDYCGFGLFSYLQQVEEWESASFALSSMSVNFCSHALFGAAKTGTVECDIRKRIMDYLNIQETDYSMVFTASRGASFKLLADAYPFATCRRLITMYDYESESVGWLVQRAKEKGAKISNVSFKWPSLRIMSTQLRKLLVARGGRRKRGSAKGLFVFPAQSRVSGAKYSYQWMSLAQQNKWHVLLDASALGPKDMDSLGLSMFRPDFIIASFYKVFGADPTGFGCLFIKDTAMQCVQNQSGAATPGIVRIIPFPFQWSSNGSSDENLKEGEGLVDEEGDGDAATDFEFPKSNQLIPVVASFSGPMLGFDKLSSPEDRSVRTEGVKEDDDNDSSVCGSAGEVSRSPVFSEEGTENLFCLDIGASPVGSASRTSMSDDQFSGPFSGPFCGPIHNPQCDGRMNPPGRCWLQNPLFEDKSSLKNESNVKEDLKNQTPGTVKNGKDGNGMDIVTLPPMSLMEAESASIQNSEEGSLKPRQGFSQAKMTRDSPALKGKNGGSFSYPHGYDGDMDGVENREQCADVRSAGNQKFEGKNQGSEIEIVDTPTAAVIAAAEPVKKLAWNQSESAIRRETEGDFCLLGRRDGNRLMPGRCLSPFTQNSEDMGSFGGGRGSFVTAEHATDLYLSQSEDNSSCHEEMGSEEAAAEQDESDDDREPEVVCRSLDHADMLGLNKATLRLRYLINWLVSSLLQLKHLSAENSMSLVHVYGPQIKYDRGASVAFNLYDCHGKLVHPELVQMLADKSNISISIGFLQNLQVPDDLDLHAFVDNKKTFKPSKGLHRGRVPSRIEVVTAALSVLSSFEDVYKLWLFVARFLDVDFVSKELVGHHKVLET